MEAKDTVMSELVYDSGLVMKFSIADRDIAKTQAEITWPIAFKAGYEAHVAEWNEGVLARGKREGIRIVVEWIEENRGAHDELDKECPFLEQIILVKKDWQAKLKEWGIK